MSNIYDDSGNNNAPDYENDLVFPPQEIKSQDDIRKPEQRKSDVLITALEKCEMLEKQLKIAVEVLEKYADNETWCLCEKNNCAYVDSFGAKLALYKIKELDK